MQLKPGRNKKYGIPYMGSKQKIIPEISKYFPNADHFYDLFGGGFSVSHYMLEHRSKSYKSFHYNEIRKGLVDLIKDSISGKYNYDIFKPEWITRERFMNEKESNAYIKICWSFGNSGKDYLFGKDIENKKRSMHQAVIFNEFDDFFINTFGFDKWPNSLTITGKRLYLRNLITKIKRNDLQRLEQLERLEQLQRLEQLERLDLTSLDYRKVKIKPNSIIYCDIPYKGTVDYGNTFNHDDFYNWASAQDNPVFISEYNIDDKRLHLLKEIKHRSKLSSQKNNSAVIEKLYGNEKAFKIIDNYRQAKHG